MHIPVEGMDFRGIAKSTLNYLMVRDIVTIAAVSIGLLSLLMPWFEYNSPPLRFPGGQDYAGLYGQYNGPKTPIELLTGVYQETFALPLLLFIAGTVLGAFTRLGGIIQASGLVAFLVTVKTMSAYQTGTSYTAYMNYHWYILVGYFFALASTLMVMFAGRRFAWMTREYGNVPATGRVTALLPRATRILR